MTKENFAKVVRLNRILSHNRQIKVKHPKFKGTLTCIWVDRGKCFATFSYKNPLATHPGLRLEVDHRYFVPFSYIEKLLNAFQERGLE